MSQELAIGTRVDHDRYGEGIVGKVNPVSYDIYFAKGGKVEVLKSNDELTVLEESGTAASTSTGFDLDSFEKLLVHTLDKYGMLQENIPLGEKWIDGTLILQPGKTGIQAKEIPIENFFHKIVMLRDRLRVLEQNINSNTNLSDEEKVNLQQYITRIYGSLTTFNILFAEKDHYFVGEKSK
jgi:hypothetical protein